MTIGSLGDVVFQVNNYKILSPSDFRTRREARYERHEVVGTLPSQEFLAPGPGTVNFSIKLRADLGCDPVSEAETLETHCEQGDVLRLIIMGKNLGQWVIKSIDQEWRYCTKLGTGPLSVDVDLELEEYH